MDFNNHDVQLAGGARREEATLKTYLSGCVRSLVQDKQGATAPAILSRYPEAAAMVETYLDMELPLRVAPFQEEYLAAEARLAEIEEAQKNLQMHLAEIKTHGRSHQGGKTIRQMRMQRQALRREAAALTRRKAMLIGSGILAGLADALVLVGLNNARSEGGALNSLTSWIFGGGTVGALAFCCEFGIIRPFLSQERVSRPLMFLSWVLGSTITLGIGLFRGHGGAVGDLTDIGMLMISILVAPVFALLSAYLIHVGRGVGAQREEIRENLGRIDAGLMSLSAEDEAAAEVSKDAQREAADLEKAAAAARRQMKAAQEGAVRDVLKDPDVLRLIRQTAFQIAAGNRLGAADKKGTPPWPPEEDYFPRNDNGRNGRRPRKDDDKDGV